MEKEAFYRRLLDEQAAGGRSMNGFAKEHGVDTSLLFRWKKILAARDAEARERVPAPAGLLPVELVGTPACPGPVITALAIGGASPEGGYFVRLRSGHEVRLPRGFDVNEVRSLVGALERSSCS
jgi:hypothetical protein